MSLSDLTSQLFGLLTRWQLTGAMIGVALVLPVCLVGLADWLIRRRR